MIIGSADRDPARFPNADELDFAHADNKQTPGSTRLVPTPVLSARRL
jgi:hypothetical protein